MEKKYGSYPGAYADIVESLVSCSEQELFKAIQEKKSYIKFLRDDFADAGVEYCDITIEEYALDYAIVQTKRFGVDISLPQTGRVVITDSFKSWYKAQWDICHNMQKS